MAAESADGTAGERWAGTRLVHPVFGSLTYSPTIGWTGSVVLERWGRTPLAVYYVLKRDAIAAPVPPTETQRKAFRQFLLRQERLVAEVDRLAADTFRGLIATEGGSLTEDAGIWQHLHDLSVFVEQSEWEPGVVNIHLHWNTPLDDEHGYTATILTENGVQSVID